MTSADHARRMRGGAIEGTRRPGKVGQWDLRHTSEERPVPSADAMFADTDLQGGRRPSLADRFVVPPTTTLFTTSGEWQSRRRLWLALGIESELGRGLTDRTSAMSLDGPPGDRGGKRSSGLTDHGPNSAVRKMSGKHALPTTGSAGQRSNLTGAGVPPEYADFGMENVAPGTSIFDPVLCECAYRWWCPEGGVILDPFAGGSVRGIVAEYLGYRYTGIELRAEQVVANRIQADALGVAPVWLAGDSAAVLPTLPPDAMYDFVFSCPPYYNLEVYSDDPSDLSNLPTYAAFLEAYDDIIGRAVARLRDDRFACFVVSDVRDTKNKLGNYHGLHGDTIAILKRHGLRLYNDAVLINPYGTLPMRMGRQMDATRKLGRSHQNVIVVAKGHPNPREWDMRVDVRPPDPQTTLWGSTSLDGTAEAPMK